MFWLGLALQPGKGISLGLKELDDYDSVIGFVQERKQLSGEIGGTLANDYCPKRPTNPIPDASNVDAEPVNVGEIPVKGGGGDIPHCAHPWLITGIIDDLPVALYFLID
jgi:hypothetical protein